MSHQHKASIFKPRHCPVEIVQHSVGNATKWWQTIYDQLPFDFVLWSRNISSTISGKRFVVLTSSIVVNPNEFGKMNNSVSWFIMICQWECVLCLSVDCCDAICAFFRLISLKLQFWLVYVVIVQPIWGQHWRWALMHRSSQFILF